MHRPILGAPRALRAAVALCLGASLAAACGGSSSSGGTPSVNDTNTNTNDNANANVNTNDNGNGNGPAALPPYTVRFHYKRADASYAGWHAFTWRGPLHNVSPSTWPGDVRYAFVGTDDFGAYTDPVEMDPAATGLSFLYNNQTGSQQTQDYVFDGLPDQSDHGFDVWIIHGDPTIYFQRPDYPAPAGARAYWLTAGTLAWPGARTDATYRLYLASQGGMQVAPDGVRGADGSFALTASASALPADLQARYPHLRTATVLAAALTSDQVKAALKGQLVVAATDGAGSVLDATQVQVQGVLDDVYAAAAAAKPLGVTFDGNGVPTFRVWAPTATSVALNTYADAQATQPESRPMALDPASGVWEWTAPDAALTNAGYYTYRVTVYSHVAGNRVVTSDVTDPYSLSLGANSHRSFVVDLKSAAAQPTGWPGSLLPTSDAPTDAVVYELHVRDFSWNDDSVTDPKLKGKFLAFTQDGLGQPWSSAGAASKGMTHLAALAGAGLTHVHLLPANDMNYVDEVACQASPAIPDPTSAADLAPQAALDPLRGLDCFHWGYSPWHYGAPEGSYSSDPADGMARVREFRRMVQALHGNGLRVVMDVVYNHATTSGQGESSVLDRVVPDYYHRLDANGDVLRDSGGADNAPELAMMEKLVTETLVTWADQYKVDGFRFDVMYLHPRAQMLRSRDAVEAVTAADGRGHTYFYGEAWDSGGAAGGNARFVTATQANLAGTGIGSFNDRLRDGVRGGQIGASGAAVRVQGFVSGQCWGPNDGSTCAAGSAAQAAALAAQDRISVGLAGNLRDFPLTASTTGAAYGGYTARPEENLVYVSCHDNETVWDVSQYKHPDAVTPADRARAQVVALSLVTLSQGVAFVQAGDDLLRSKSEDGDGYDSGDHFNRIFWDGASNNWGVGAPPQWVPGNASHLQQIQAVFANPNARVTQQHMLDASAAFQDFLRVRRSSSMFHLPSAAQVKACVSFPDQPAQRAGLIVMRIGDGATTCGDGAYRQVWALFNATDAQQVFSATALAGHALALHPAQAGGHDPVVTTTKYAQDGTAGTFTLPPRTTAVFVEAQP